MNFHTSILLLTLNIKRGKTSKIYQYLFNILLNSVMELFEWFPIIQFSKFTIFL